MCVIITNMTKKWITLLKKSLIILKKHITKNKRIMLEEYKKLLCLAQKYKSEESESIIIVDGKSFYSCSLITETLSKLKIDKPKLKNKEWKEFWKLCKESFPLHSIHGTAKNVKEIEVQERNQAHFSNFLDLPIKTYNKLYKGRVFEIGYGYGYFGKQIMDKNIWDADYYGIDYVASDKSLLNYKKNGKKRFYEISKSGIPIKFQKQKFDLIYSVNVMQHLTQKQRKDYFKQVTKMMDVDSVFFFDVLEWNYEVMGDKERDGYCTNFFGVKTYIDTPEEMIKILEECGLHVIHKKIKCLSSAMKDETNSVRYICSLT